MNFIQLHYVILFCKYSYYNIMYLNVIIKQCIGTYGYINHEVMLIS